MREDDQIPIFVHDPINFSSTLEREWNGRYIEDDIYKCVFFNLNSTVTETYTTAFPGLLCPGSCNLLPI